MAMFNVKDYGALGDNTHDDTVHIRAAIAAAIAQGGGTILFPAGTYLVCPQLGDPTLPSLPNYPVIFPITTSNLIFQGTSPTNSIISCLYTGLLDPKTNWAVTGQSYVKIKRFGAFRISSNAGPVSNIAWHNLRITGNAGYTGNVQVGGNPHTGDGWDLTHKCIGVDGSHPITGIIIDNCILDNWRGEIVYGGGTNIDTFDVTRTSIYGTNASAISVSANMIMSGLTIGGVAAGQDVYNGIENFNFVATQKTSITNSTLQCTSNGAGSFHGNGLVYLGGTTSSLTVNGCIFNRNNKAILLSEGARNVTIENSNFTSNGNGIINSVLNIYPGFVTGFSDWTIHDNTYSGPGDLFVSQSEVKSNLSFKRNTLNANGRLFAGNFPSIIPNFVCDSNTFNAGAVDIGSMVGNGVALWTNSIRPGGDATAGDKFNNFVQGANSGNLSFKTDLTILNSNTLTSGNFSIDMDPTVVPFYPVGFTTLVKPGSKHNWVLKANPAWNTFLVDVPVGFGVTIKVGASGKFGVVP